MGTVLRVLYVVPRHSRNNIKCWQRCALVKSMKFDYVHDT